MVPVGRGSRWPASLPQAIESKSEASTPQPSSCMHNADVGGTSREHIWDVELGFWACGGGSATERVLTWRKCQQPVMVRVSGKKGGVFNRQSGVRGQGSRRKRSICSRNGSMAPALLAGPGPLPCLGGFGSAVFQRLASYEGLPIVVLKCNPPSVVPVEARDTPRLTPHLHGTCAMGIQEHTTQHGRFWVDID